MASEELQHMILCQLREIHAGWIMLDPGCYINTELDDLPEIKLLEYDSNDEEVLFCDDNNDSRCILHDTSPGSLVLIVDGDAIYMWFEEKLREALRTVSGLDVCCETVFDDSGEFVGQRVPLCYTYGALEAVFDVEIGHPYAPWATGHEYSEYFGPKTPPINVVVQ